MCGKHNTRKAASIQNTSSVQSKGAHWKVDHFSSKDRVDNLKHYVNWGNIGQYFAFSEVK